MNKRGQIYIAAAIIITGLIFGLNSVYNYASASDEDKNLEYLSSEIDFEASSVIDRGVFRSESQTETDNKIKEIARYYADLNPRTELIVLFGNTASINAYYYALDEEGRTCIETGGIGSCSGVDLFQKVETSPIYTITGNQIILNVNDFNYPFSLRAGQNFYIVLIKQKDDERFVSSPEI